MRADLIEVVEAAGLDHEDFEVVAEAPTFADLPAILVGTFRGNNAAIRAYNVAAPPESLPDPDAAPHWHATAFVSRHPGLALQCLTEAEQERLRAEALTPSGHAAPVGQAAVIPERIEPGEAVTPAEALGAPIDSTAVELPDDDSVGVAPAPCGGANCMVFTGPHGAQEAHDANTCPASATADRG